MTDFMCTNNSIIGIVFLILIILIVVNICMMYYNYYGTQNNRYKKNVMSNIYDVPDSHTVYVDDNHVTNVKNVKNVENVDDLSVIEDELIKKYDYNNAFDPFVEPVRRVARHDIHPMHLKRVIDYPTRGYPDNYIQMGVLTKRYFNNIDDTDNKVIRLFGRQEYPGSNRYEYFIMVNSGPDSIKIPLDSGRKIELYDGDDIDVKELEDIYKVHLYKYDAPRYYPDIK